MRAKMVTPLLLAAAGLLLPGWAVAEAPPVLTVGIRRSCRRVVIAGTKGLRLTDLISGQKIFSRWNNKPILFTTHQDGFKVHGIGVYSRVQIEPMRDSVLTVDRSGYRGSMVVQDDRMGRITVINHVDVETYLRAVIKGEMIISAHPEALKAQAVVARTFAIKNRHRYTGQYGFGLSADTSSQVYRGVREEHPRATAAVQATRGLVLTYNGELIDSYYHSACGGFTQNCQDVWCTSRAYLRSVQCDFCRHYEDNFYWKQAVTHEELLAALLEKGYKIGRIEDVGPSYDQAGRVRALEIAHAAGKLRLNASQFRTVMGPLRIRSTFFRVGDGQRGKETEAQVMPEAEMELQSIISGYLRAKSEDEKITIFGRGSGHGVGLCQWGARKQAELGRTFDGILSFYYSGVKITRLY